MTVGALISIDFERLKRLLDSAHRRRSIATENADLPAAKAASDNMITLSDHALRCCICKATVAEHRGR
jgi:hypothetical protein